MTTKAFKAKKRKIGRKKQYNNSAHYRTDQHHSSTDREKFLAR